MFLWGLPGVGLLNPALTSHPWGNIQNTEKFAQPLPAQNIRTTALWASFIVSAPKYSQKHLPGGRTYFGLWFGEDQSSWLGTTG